MGVSAFMTVPACFRRCRRIASLGCLPVLLQGCAVIPAAIGAPMALQAALGGAELAHAHGTQPIPPDTLASRAFAYPPIIVRPAVEHAAQRDGRRIEASRSALIVSYPASPSTGDGAGSIAVESHGRGLVTFTTTVIVLRGPTGGVEAGRRAGEQLLDAVAADIADIERRVATTTIALDAATVFDALVRVGQGLGREVLARDDTTHSLRVSVLTLGAGYLDIRCLAAGSETVVIFAGDDQSPAVEIRKAAIAVQAALARRLGQPE